MKLMIVNANESRAGLASKEHAGLELPLHHQKVGVRTHHQVLHLDRRILHEVIPLL